MLFKAITVISVLFVFFDTLFLVSCQLRWDAPDVWDGECVFPKTIPFPESFILPVRVLRQRHFYLPMGNKAWYRWMFQKVTNRPAFNQQEIDALKPRSLFPDIELHNLSVVTHYMTNPPNTYYQLMCYPNHPAGINSSCTISNANPGAASAEFGALWFANTAVWADETSWSDWRCIGERQIFSVISQTPT